MWSNVVEETGEPGENHRTWTGDHYPATCLDPDIDYTGTGWRIQELANSLEIERHAKISELTVSRI